MGQRDVLCLISAITSLFLFIKIIWAPTMKPGKCSVENSSDGLPAAICSNNPFVSEDMAWEFPKDISSSVQIVDLSEKNNQPSGFLIYAYTFHHYTQLRRIIIKRNKYMDTSSEFLKVMNKNMLEQAFKYIDTLEYLEFSHSWLHDDYIIHLPKNLKILNVDNNQYENLNAHWAEELREINAAYNKLKNIPQIHFSGPPLEKLRLKQNPLDKMTVLDIAPLCELVVLELDFTGLKSYYNTAASYCDCIMLKQWASDAALAGLENLTCVQPNGNKPKCSDKILEDGRSMRKKCPLLKKGDVVANKLYSILKYVFMSILLLLLLAVAILYVIRHFHLREVWAAHHMSQSAISAKMEEEEEEASQERGSSSEGSA